ncbi:MAG: hypothetical protein ACKOT0_00160 [bacterium]
MRARYAGAAFALVALLAGCGVPLDAAPRPLPSGALPTFVPSPTETPTEGPVPPLASARLWFVEESTVTPVVGAVATRDAPSLITALAIGPPADDPRLRTLVVDPFTGQPLVTAVPNDPPRVGVTTVSVSPAFSQLPPAEQVLLLGQVVLTLTGINEVSGVVFVTPEGQPLAVPLPDGRLLDRPATAADYRSLIVGP